MNSHRWIYLAAWAAVLAKLCCAALTVGTNDVDAFFNFGRFIWNHGLLEQYRATREFNHTPLVGWFCAAAYGLAHDLGFPWLMRLPGIVADFLVVRTLLETREWRDRLPTWALLLLAVNPVNFMISGFHGNVDPILVWLVLLAARECTRGRASWCGLFLGLACQVKVIPLLLAPAFFFFWLARGRAQPFFVIASATTLIGWSVPLVFLPQIFATNVLGYSSNWGSWGLTYWLHASGAPAFSPVGFQGLTNAQTAIMSALKLAIIGTTFWISWQRRRIAPGDFPTTLMLVWATFFVLSPGVGAQYLVWFGPLLLLQAPRWFATVTLASATFLFVFYTTICRGLPWNHGVSTAELLPIWVGWSTLPWLALAAFLAAAMRSGAFKRSSHAASPALGLSGRAVADRAV